MNDRTPLGKPKENPIDLMTKHDHADELSRQEILPNIPKEIFMPLKHILSNILSCQFPEPHGSDEILRFPSNRAINNILQEINAWYGLAKPLNINNELTENFLSRLPQIAARYCQIEKT